MKKRLLLIMLCLIAGSFIGTQALAQMGQEEEGAADIQQEEPMGTQPEAQQPPMGMEEEQPQVGVEEEQQDQQLFGTEEEAQPEQEAQMAAGQQDQFNRASSLIGQTVQNQQGQKLGTISDIIISDQGEVNYLILASGGFLGMGEKLIPVPWGVANVTMQDNAVQVSLDQEQLANAPSFRQENWPNFSEQSFQEEVYGYYGEQPPQQQPGMEQPGMEQQQQPGMEQQQQPGMEEDMMDLEQQDQMEMEEDPGLLEEEQQQQY